MNNEHRDDLHPSDEDMVALHEVFGTSKTRDPERDRRERAFLQAFVFRGLQELDVSFDAKSILYFRAEDFLQVLKRCARFGVEVYGIEIFRSDAQMVLVEISQTGSPLSFLPIVLRFCNRTDISVCATFSVPESLLTIPATVVEAYTGTVYDAILEDQILPIRIEQDFPAIQRLIDADAFIITAANPFCSKQSEFTNDVQNKILEERLEHLGGQLYPTVAARGTEWEEAGFLVMGLSEVIVRELAIEFGQNAIVKIPTDGPVELLWLR